MTSRLQTLLVALAVTIYCGWSAREMVNSWWHTPFNRLGWLAFLIWLLPLIRETCRRRIEPLPVLLWGGLACSLVGTIGEQNSLCYVGVACALAALPQWSFAVRLLWLAASVSWMTIFGYFMQRASVSGANVMRLRLIAVACAISLILFLTRRRSPVQT